MATAKLQAAFSEQKVVVKKKISGEVMIKFHRASNLPDIVLSNDKPLDLLARKGVTVPALEKSNLAQLIPQFLDLVD